MGGEGGGDKEMNKSGAPGERSGGPVLSVGEIGIVRARGRRIMPGQLGRAVGELTTRLRLRGCPAIRLLGNASEGVMHDTGVQLRGGLCTCAEMALASHC